MDGLLRRATAEYRQRLAEQVELLAELVGMAIEGTGSDRRREAIHLAHRLCGTSGSFGFDEVSRAAGAIEALLQRWEGNEVFDEDAGVEPDLRRALGELRDAAYKSRDDRRLDPTPRTMRLLVVDDDPEFLAMMERHGQRRGVDVVTARTGQEAIRVAAERAIDATIVDSALGPGEDAIALAHVLRSLSRGHNLPIAFCSVDRDVSLRLSATSAGASLFLDKPIDFATFDVVIGELLANAGDAPATIVLLDDDADFARLVAAMLASERVDLVPHHDPETILEALDHYQPDLLLLDVSLPGINGFDVCRVLRASTRWRALPIVFLTAKNEVSHRTEAFRAGGDDYLAKPVLRAELIARVVGRLERVLAERNRFDRDSLTGLLTRRPLLEALRSRVAECKRHGWSLAVCLLDVDKLKEVNDTHGHLVGDQLLALFGAMLNRFLRAEDLRGRWGGDEIILVFARMGEAGIIGALERLRDEVLAIRIEGADGAAVPVSFSAGVACLPEDGLDLEDLIEVADRRLYRAKRNGSMKVCTRG